MGPSHCQFIGTLRAVSSGACRTDGSSGSGPAVEVGPGVWRIRNSGLASNTYVCRLGDHESCFVVDPGLDEETVRRGIEAVGLRPIGVFCTHGHFDHVASAAAIRDEYGAPVHLHEADVALLRSANFHMMLARVSGRISIPEVDVVASSGSKYLSGEDQVEFIHAPGHTEGSCCLRFGQYVFTGDTLYRNSVGLVNFPGEDREVLRASLVGLWETLPASSVICPGHGGAGTLEGIKANNVELMKFLEGAPHQEGD